MVLYISASSSVIREYNTKPYTLMTEALLKRKYAYIYALL